MRKKFIFLFASTLVFLLLIVPMSVLAAEDNQADEGQTFFLQSYHTIISDPSTGEVLFEVQWDDEQPIIYFGSFSGISIRVFYGDFEYTRTLSIQKYDTETIVEIERSLSCGWPNKNWPSTLSFSDYFVGGAPTPASLWVEVVFPCSVCGTEAMYTGRLNREGTITVLDPNRYRARFSGTVRFERQLRAETVGCCD